MILPDGSSIPLAECKVTVQAVDRSIHVSNLLAEGSIKLSLNQEQDRRRVIFQRLTNPYFSLPGFPKVCRHGPLPEDQDCPICEKDKQDALRRFKG